MSEPLKVLDLFSGIGGFSLGLERTGGFETVAFCEIDPYCQRVLARHWPYVPIHPDVRELDGSAYEGIDLVCGGFPCQPFSTASRGRRVAADLWPELMRIVGRARPLWVVAENVPGLGDGGIDRVCHDLESAGYEVQAFDLDTAPEGRQRARARLFFVAYADREGEPRRTEHAEMASLCPLPGRGPDDPCPLGVDDGLPHRMDRLRALGNAVVPQVVELIGSAILAAEGKL